MPKKISELSNLLAASEAQTQAAQAAAAAEARRQHKANKKAATDATDNMYEAVAHATGVAKANGDYPAVTDLMNRIAVFAVTGGGHIPTVHTDDPSSQEGVSQVEFDIANQEANRFQEELEGAKETIGNLEKSVQTLTGENERLETDLETAEKANRDLNTRIAGKDRELETQSQSLTTVTDERNEANRKLGEAEASSNGLQRQLNAVREERNGLRRDLDVIKTSVAALPEIDLTRKTFSGKEVRMPVAKAKQYSDGRAYLRQVFGLDPAQDEPEPAAEQPPAAPVRDDHPVFGPDEQ